MFAQRIRTFDFKLISKHHIKMFFFLFIHIIYRLWILIFIVNPINNKNKTTILLEKNGFYVFFLIILSSY
jgi:hypothetical protein